MYFQFVLEYTRSALVCEFCFVWFAMRVCLLALQGQRDWDRRYRDNLIVLFFVIRMLKEKLFFFAIVCNLIVVVTNTTVESLR